MREILREETTRNHPATVDSDVVLYKSDEAFIVCREVADTVYNHTEVDVGEDVGDKLLKDKFSSLVQAYQRFLTRSRKSF